MWLWFQYRATTAEQVQAFSILREGFGWLAAEGETFSC